MNNFYKYPYSRNALPHQPPIPKHPQKNKFNFKTLKNDACTSLNDVEHFLCNFSDFLKYIKLIKLLK